MRGRVTERIYIFRVDTAQPVVYDQRIGNLAQVADLRQLFCPDVENLEEEFVAPGLVRFDQDFVPQVPHFDDPVVWGRFFGGGVRGVQAPAAPCFAPGAVEAGAEEEGGVDQRQEGATTSPEGCVDFIGAPVLFVERALDALIGSLDTDLFEIADDDLNGVFIGRSLLCGAFNDEADGFAAAIGVDAETVAVLVGVAGVIQQLVGAVGIVFDDGR